MRKDEDTKKMVDCLAQVASTFQSLIDGKGSVLNDADKMNWIERMYEDLLEYCIYLCCGDGFISNEEAEAIDYYLEYTISPVNIANRANMNELFSQSFLEKVPSTLNRFIAMDNAIYKVRDSKSEEQINGKTSLMLFTLYRRLGTAMIGCDGGGSPNQTGKMIAYLNMLWNCILKDQEFDYDPREEYKEKDEISGGVRAPLWKGTKKNVSDIPKAKNAESFVKKDNETKGKETDAPFGVIRKGDFKNGINIKTATATCRDIIEKYTLLVDALDKMVDLTGRLKLEDCHFSDMVLADIRCALIYVAKETNDYNNDVVDFISEVCGEFNSAIRLKKMAEDEKMIPKDFVTVVPISLTIMLMVEGELCRNGVISRDKTASKMFGEIIADLMDVYAKFFENGQAAGEVAQKLADYYKEFANRAMNLDDISVKAPEKDAEKTKYMKEDSVKAPKKS